MDFDTTEADMGVMIWKFMRGGAERPRAFYNFACQTFHMAAFMGISLLSLRVLMVTRVPGFGRRARALWKSPIIQSRIRFIKIWKMLFNHIGPDKFRITCACMWENWSRFAFTQ